MRKHCKTCHASLHRWGKTPTGKQRWKCPYCSTTKSSVRADVSKRHRANLFVSWLRGTESLTAFSKRHAYSRKTLSTWFSGFWDSPPKPIYPESLSDTYIVVDALYLTGHHDCVLICRTGKGHVFWAFAPQETLLAWLDFLRKIPKPCAVVCDGQSGLLSAIQTLWPDVPVQRCLAHMQRLAIQKLTRRPHTAAGQELLALVYTITKVKTEAESVCWIAAFRAWNKRHELFLKERTYGPTAHSSHGWWYTHRRILALKRTLEQALRNLFVHTEQVGVPATTNLVEGGINSRLRELLHRHRGFSIPHKKVLIAYVLESINKNKKPTRNVT